MSLFLRPSTSKGIPNTFLRKKRKWPRSPYKTKWHYLFAQQQAMEKLKNLSVSPPSEILEEHSQAGENQCSNKIPRFLSYLITSFTSYDCEATPGAYQFILRTLTLNSQFVEVRSVLDHIEMNEKFEMPEGFFVNLMRVYGRKGLFKEAIDLFFRIPNFRCIPTATSLNALLLILCRNKELVRMVPDILIRSQRMKVRVDESSFLILIKVLCRNGKVGHAIKLMDDIIDDGLMLDDKVYASVLSSLCKSEGVSSCEVLGFFKYAKSNRFCPGRGDFHNVISFLVKQRKGLDALSILGEMKTQGIKPDIDCYTTVLHGVVENEELTRAEDLFDEILVFGLVPNIRTYHVYLNCLCKQGKVEAGYKMICCMEQLGSKPDSDTYSIVLEGFHRLGELQKAREVWTEMNTKGLPLDSQMYQVMLDVIVTEGDFLGACKFLEGMLSKNFVPLSPTISSVVIGMCEGGYVSEAIEMLEKLAGCDVGFGDRAWESLLLKLKINDCSGCIDDYLSDIPLLALDELKHWLLDT